MPRIRTVKPELAAHEGLYDAEVETGLPLRFAWVMLFTQCDREGRFKWQPRTLKAGILPHDDIDFSRVLDAWVTRGFVRKYRVRGQWFGCIPTWNRHQVINNRETASELPSPDEDDSDNKDFDASTTRQSRVDDASTTRAVRKGREEKGREGNVQEARATDAELMDGFAAIVSRYPKRSTAPSILDEREYAHRIQEGVPHAELEAGVERYAKFCEAGGVSGPLYVTAIKNFFANPQRMWREAWEPPASKAEQREDENLAETQRWLQGAGNA